MEKIENIEQTLETMMFSAYLHGRNQEAPFKGWYDPMYKNALEKFVQECASQELSEYKERLKKWADENKYQTCERCNLVINYKELIDKI